MPERLPLNSQSLQKRFPEVYRDLFENYPIVTSTALHVGFAANGFGQKIGAPVVWQKLPFRLYMGFSPGGKKFEIREIHFDSQRNQFKEGVYGSFDWKKFALRYPTWCRSRHPIENGRVILLWETGHARGIGTNEYLHFAVLPYLLKGDSLIKEFSSEKLDVDSVQLAKNPLLLRSFRDMWELTLILSRRGFSSNSLGFASLVSSPYPILTWSKVVSDIQAIPTASFLGFRFPDLFSPIPLGMSPDISLIYPGTSSVRFDLLPHYERMIRTRYMEYIKFSRSLFARINADTEVLDMLELETAHEKTFYTLGVLAVDLLHSLFAYYQSGGAEQLTQVCRSLRMIRNMKAVREGDPSLAVRRILKGMSTLEEDLTATPLGIGEHDGDVLVVARPQKYRPHITKFVDAHPEYLLEYASWIDGWGEEGFKIEQHLEQGIKSDFLGGDAVKLTTYYRGRVDSQHIQYSSIDRGVFDLLLDDVEGKVWVKGQATTSKDLPSQKGIVALLRTLLPKMGQSVPNDTLEESPYKHYRNELQSKLSGPLEEVLAKRTKKKLGLAFTGGLTRFTIKFEPGQIKIGLIESA